MPQVLEAPPIQGEARKPIAIDDRVSAAALCRTSVARRRPVMSLFRQPSPEHTPVCADATVPYESALDRICRIDPYLYIRSLVG